MKKQIQTGKRKLVVAASLMAVVGMAAIPAHAVTSATTTMAVTATIAATCTIAATSLPFGTYTQATASAGMATLTVTCTDLTAYNVGLDGGVAGATATQRYMKGATNTSAHLNYNLYSDATYTTAWGNTTGTNTVTGTGTGAAQSLTVYGMHSGKAILSRTHSAC